MSLEDKLRALAAAGELNYLSLCPVVGKGPGNIVYAAAYAPASTWESGMGRDADPVKAIEAALADRRVSKLFKIRKAEAKAVAGFVPVDDADFV